MLLLELKLTELFGGPDAFKYAQPAQFPYMNVNDLGFFNSLQSRYYRTSPKNSVEMVEYAHETYPLEKKSRIG
jgi:hypothetical protein